MVVAALAAHQGAGAKRPSFGRAVALCVLFGWHLFLCAGVTFPDFPAWSTALLHAHDSAFAADYDCPTAAVFGQPNAVYALGLARRVEEKDRPLFEPASTSRIQLSLRSTQIDFVGHHLAGVGRCRHWLARSQCLQCRFAV